MFSKLATLIYYDGTTNNNWFFRNFMNFNKLINILNNHEFFMIICITLNRSTITKIITSIHNNANCVYQFKTDTCIFFTYIIQYDIIFLLYSNAIKFVKFICGKIKKFLKV